jgi:hypothetical protein
MTRLSIDERRVLHLLQAALKGANSRSVQLRRNDVKHGTQLVIAGLAERTRDNRYEATLAGVKIQTI